MCLKKKGDNHTFRLYWSIHSNEAVSDLGLYLIWTYMQLWSLETTQEILLFLSLRKQNKIMKTLIIQNPETKICRAKSFSAGPVTMKWLMFWGIWYNWQWAELINSVVTRQAIGNQIVINMKRL